MLACAVICIAAMNESKGRVGLKLQRLIVVRDSAIEISALMISDAAVGEGVRVMRIELDGVAEVRDRAVVFAVIRVGQAPVEESHCERFRPVTASLYKRRAAGDARFRVVFRAAPPVITMACNDKNRG